ncbi:MAG: hypothetical protein ACLU3F_17630 [Blautia wexlerae]
MYDNEYCCQWVFSTIDALETGVKIVNNIHYTNNALLKARGGSRKAFRCQNY